MDPDPTLIAEVCQRCYLTLTNNLRPCDGLAVYLVTKRHLTFVEKQNIYARATPFQQATELVDILTQKDDEALDALLAFVTKNGPQHLVRSIEEAKAQILEQRCPTPSNAQKIKADSHGQLREPRGPFGGASGPPTGATSSTCVTDFSLEYKAVHHVVEILTADPDVLLRWDEILHKFELLPLTTVEVQDRLSRGQRHGAIIQTMQAWISKGGPQVATYDKLVGIFEEAGFAQIAAKLKESDKKDKIWDANNKK